MDKQELYNIVVNILKENGIDFQKAYLAGSFAYGNPDRHSDIDIVVQGKLEKKIKYTSKLGIIDIFIKPKEETLPLNHFKQLGHVEKNTLVLTCIELPDGEILKGSPEDEEFFIKRKKEFPFRHQKPIKNTVVK